MSTLALTIDDAILAQLNDLAASGEDLNQFATELFSNAVRYRRNRERGLAEGRALLE